MIIGIGGMSRAGKTTFSKRLAQYLGSENTIIFHQDDYVKPEDEVPYINERLDWDHPEAMDYEGLIQAIKNADSGNVIVEGILVFFNSELRNMFDKKILMEVEKSTFLARKRVDKRWGPEPEWFIEHIWQSYQQFGKPEDFKDYILIKENDELDLKPIFN
ncbi:uridine kinase family protein [Fulvivirga sediminis]|uniref:AAA family ATPase n=1 Tax=Fulvivirga sediminis TaxID=2803949 RepID=A0A937F448_9BACT|nr:AAA family ATPase [Fulvivirga sediminis]MBL3654532.1 AAA family ATPase [Fulvivirga sediminis]